MTATEATTAAPEPAEIIAAKELLANAGYTFVREGRVDDSQVWSPERCEAILRDSGYNVAEFRARALELAALTRLLRFYPLTADEGAALALSSLQR